MKLNSLERFLMNSWVRNWFLRNFEAKLLLGLGEPIAGNRVLEVACGTGVLTEILLENRAQSVVAIDIDEWMIQKAKRRLKKYSTDRLQILEADLRALPFEENAFDSVVAMAVVHHVPIWQDAVQQIFRVLKPGGQFFFEELTEQWINRTPYRQLFDHPRENRFDARSFGLELEKCGFRLETPIVEKKGGDFIFGVARKPSAVTSSM